MLAYLRLKAILARSARRLRHSHVIGLSVPSYLSVWPEDLTILSAGVQSTLGAQGPDMSRIWQHKVILARKFTVPIPEQDLSHGPHLPISRLAL